MSSSPSHRAQGNDEDADDWSRPRDQVVNEENNTSSSCDNDLHPTHEPSTNEEQERNSSSTTTTDDDDNNNQDHVILHTTNDNDNDSPQIATTDDQAIQGEEEDQRVGESMLETDQGVLDSTTTTTTEKDNDDKEECINHNAANDDHQDKEKETTRLAHIKLLALAAATQMSRRRRRQQQQQQQEETNNQTITITTSSTTTTTTMNRLESIKQDLIEQQRRSKISPSSRGGAPQLEDNDEHDDSPDHDIFPPWKRQVMASSSSSSSFRRPGGSEISTLGSSKQPVGRARFQATHDASSVSSSLGGGVPPPPPPSSEPSVEQQEQLGRGRQLSDSTTSQPGAYVVVTSSIYTGSEHDNGVSADDREQQQPVVVVPQGDEEGQEEDEEQQQQVVPSSENGFVQENALVSAQLVDDDRENALQAEIERLRRNIETATEVVADLEDEEEGAQREQSMGMQRDHSRDGLLDNIARRKIWPGFAALVVLIGVVLGLALAQGWIDRESGAPADEIEGSSSAPSSAPTERPFALTEEQELALQDAGLTNFTIYMDVIQLWETILTDERTGSETVTILAPTQDAYSDFLAEFPPFYFDNGQYIAHRRHLLLHHAFVGTVEGVVHSLESLGTTNLTMLSGEKVQVFHQGQAQNLQFSPGRVGEELATIVTPRVLEINSRNRSIVVHAVDRVLLVRFLLTRGVDYDLIREHGCGITADITFRELEQYPNPVLFTFFCVADSAYEEMEEEHVAALVAPVNTTEKQILSATIFSYYVLGSLVLPRERMVLQESRLVTAYGGQSLEVHWNEGVLSIINNADELSAKIIETDLLMFDGIVHVIDSILAPDSLITQFIELQLET